MHKYTNNYFNTTQRMEKGARGWVQGAKSAAPSIVPDGSLSNNLLMDI
jgi:hypothetical protein